MPYVRPDRQQVILAAIDTLVQQDPHGWTTTQAIAALTGSPKRSVLYYLQRLEQQGKIERLYHNQVIRRIPEGDVPPE